MAATATATYPAAAAAVGGPTFYPGPPLAVPSGHAAMHAGPNPPAAALATAGTNVQQLVAAEGAAMNGAMGHDSAPSAAFMPVATAQQQQKNAKDSHRHNHTRKKLSRRGMSKHAEGTSHNASSSSSDEEGSSELDGDTPDDDVPKSSTKAQGSAKVQSRSGGKGKSSRGTHVCNTGTAVCVVCACTMHACSARTIAQAHTLGANLMHALCTVTRARLAAFGRPRPASSPPSTCVHAHTQAC